LSELARVVERERESVGQIALARGLARGLGPEVDGPRIEALLTELVAYLDTGGLDAESVSAVDDVSPARDAIHDAVFELVGARELPVAGLRLVSNWRQAGERAARRRHESALVDRNRRLSMLSKVSTLAEAEDEEGVLAAIARLAVPELADLCIVDVIEEGVIRRAQVFHHDPSKRALAEAIRTTSAEAVYRSAAWQAMLVGSSHLIKNFDECVVPECDSALREVIRAIESRSLLAVPLRVFGKTIAVATFITTADSERSYGPADLAIAEEIAARAATLLENARLHQQLRDRDAHLQIALAESNVCVFEQDASSHLKWIYNPLLDAAMQPIGPSALSSMPREALEKIMADKRQALRTGRPTRSELSMEVRGEPRSLVLTHVPLRDAAGAVTGLVGATIDVTDQKRVQAQLNEALTFRDQVMGILGHDLRNPLSAVLGVVGLARLDPKLPERASQHLAQIDAATRRMLELIGTLLDFSQARFADAMPIAPTEMDFVHTLERVIGELRLGRPERAIELEVHGDTRGEWDPARMAQVVSNLLGNALQHGDDRTPVRVRVEAGEEEIAIEVHNDGAPIAPTLLPQVFDAFRRGTPSDARGARGLGLGLFIAKQIVRAHGGNIAVDSTEQEGTSFVVHLPRVVVGSAPQLLHSSAPSL
jgi:signal transduction histidine kinase